MLAAMLYNLCLRKKSQGTLAETPDVTLHCLSIRWNLTKNLLSLQYLNSAKMCEALSSQQCQIPCIAYCSPEGGGRELPFVVSVDILPPANSDGNALQINMNPFTTLRSKVLQKVRVIVKRGEGTSDLKWQVQDSYQFRHWTWGCIPAVLFIHSVFLEKLKNKKQYIWHQIPYLLSEGSDVVIRVKRDKISRCLFDEHSIDSTYYE